MERRRGIEPCTPNLQLGRSPLAVAAHGASGVIRTPNGGFGIRWPHHRQPGQVVLDSNQHCTAFEAAASAVGLRAHGRLGRIRTDTGRGLSAPPLPGWATSLLCSGRDSNSQQCGSQPHASTGLRHPNIGGQSRIRTLDVSRRVTGATARRFQPLGQLPKRELSKIWRKAGDLNAYVPKDRGLANQWDTNYPSLPGTTNRFRGKLQA